MRDLILQLHFVQTFEVNVISVKDSLTLGCILRDISIRNKASISVKADRFEDIEESSIELSVLERFLEDIKLDEFFEEEWHV